MNYIKIKNGFTLAEVLMSIAVIGILSAILIPNLFNNAPKESTVMLKKAYQATSKVLVDMINDATIYPDEEQGFATSSMSTFCENFAKKMNHISYTESNCDVTYGSKPEPFMQTNDGMKWYFIGNDAYTGDDNAYGYKIIVDINGKKGPNCQLSTLGHCTSSENLAVGDEHTCVEAIGKGCDNPDTFIISINRKGRIAGATSFWLPTGSTAQEPYDAKILENATKLSL